MSNATTGTPKPAPAVTTTAWWDQRPGWIPWIVFLFGLTVLMPSIWSETSVTGSDEYTLTLRTPMEMKERDQWLTPWVNGELRLRKPPLMYWLILANYHLFGVGLVAARIWSVLAGAGLAVVACQWSRELFRSNGKGLLTGLLTVSCIGIAAQARQAMLDLPLAFFVSLAILFGLRWLRTGRLIDALAAGVWLGLSFLTKGPIGFFFFGSAAVAAVFCLSAFPILKQRGWHWLLAVAVVAAISVPWPLAMQQIWGDRFAQIMGEELAAREFGSWHGKSPLSALGGALGLIAPWTPMVVVAIWEFFRTPKSERLPANRWLIATFFISILPFFFMTTFERYMLSVVPTQAALAAHWLAPGGRIQRLTMAFAALIFGILAFAVGSFALWFQLGIIIPLLSWTLAVTAFLWAQRGVDPIRVVALCGVVLALVFGGLYPRLGLNGLPAGIETVIGSRPTFTFDRMQPAMLSPRLGRSVLQFTPERLTNSLPAVVFVDRPVVPDFQKRLSELGLQAQEITRYKTFYSRKVWIRFARADATAADWQAALKSRSLEGLKTDLIGFEVSRPPAP
ncbi:MAG: glycosyltransferase family 39 protein [Verrucomicrobia bacterium]|nr:glycosyltransferase family 39 protein [Verrucomicrobiota bacterium]